MKIFENYARYYNVLYSEKNYLSEAQFVNEIIKNFAPESRSILELGCGTGIHAQHLAQIGYDIHGIDQSEQMLECAHTNQAKLSPALKKKIAFSKGDIRQIRLSRTFDAVIALFHVMSYQVTNSDLEAAFCTAKSHLRPGGIFLFDCWYGPAVLTIRPSVRVKRFDDGEISILRMAEPIMYPNDNSVDVNYSLIIQDKKTNGAEEIKETHRVRYLFTQEIALLCSAAGLKIIDGFEWLSRKKPGFDTWSVCFVCKLDNEQAQTCEKL